MADENAEQVNTENRDRGLHRHSDPDPSKWDEAEAVTARPNDTPLRGVDKPAVPNSTLSSRAKSRTSAESDAKAVDGGETENKAVKPAQRARKAR